MISSSTSLYIVQSHLPGIAKLWPLIAYAMVACRAASWFLAFLLEAQEQGHLLAAWCSLPPTWGCSYSWIGKIWECHLDFDPPLPRGLTILAGWGGASIVAWHKLKSTRVTSNLKAQCTEVSFPWSKCTKQLESCSGVWQRVWQFVLTKKFSRRWWQNGREGGRAGTLNKVYDKF